MKHRTTPLLLTIICLLTLFSAPSARGADGSWEQVFNFQLKLAEQGNVTAQYILGEMYELGRGVDKDPDSAIDWYRKAEQNGHTKAAARIARIQEAKQREVQEKARLAEEQRRREEAQARQAAEQQRLEQEAARQQAQRAEATRLEQERLARARAEEQARTKQDAETTLTPEQRAEKIKQAQARAEEIAKQNALLQQQAADAELEKYRQTVQPTPPPAKPTQPAPTFVNPFE